MACRRAAIVDLSSGGSQSSDEHRSALLRHLDVVNQTAQQSTTKLRCKSCKHVMTGVGERIAAHFAQVSGRSVVICSEPPQQAKEVREKFLPELANKRNVGAKRKRDQQATKVAQQTIIQAWDGTGKERTDAAFSRWLFATDQAFDAGSNVYFKTFLSEVRQNPTWVPRGREAISKTDLIKEHKRVDEHSKASIESTVAKTGKTIQTDGWSNARVSSVHRC